MGAVLKGEVADIFAAGKKDKLAPGGFRLEDVERGGDPSVVISNEGLIQKTGARLLGIRQEFEDAEPDGEIELVLSSPAEALCGTQLRSALFSNVDPEIRVDLHLVVTLGADLQEPVLDRPVQLRCADFLLQSRETADRFERHCQRLAVQGEVVSPQFGEGEVFFDLRR